MSGPILANDPKRTTNAQAVADLATLGLITVEDHMLDLTVGPEGGFWKLWRPNVLVTNDVNPDVAADHHFDARDNPWAHNTFDTVVWDPPYGYRGTSTLASDARYGLTTYTTPDDIDALLLDGMKSALFLARRTVLVKCQDQNIASRFRDQSGFVTEAAREAGATVAGKLYVAARREQPAGKKQLNVWGYHSVLLVLR